MNMSVAEQSMNQATKDITEITYDPPVVEYKIPVKVGDAWSTQSNKNVHTVKMQRSEEGSWQKQGESDTTVNATMYYEVISEEKITVKAGTFGVLKIKSNETGNSTYMYEYVTSNGIPVRMDMYSEDGMISVELVEYQTAETDSSSSSTSGGIPGFEAVAGIFALSIAGLLYSRKRR